MLEELGYKSMIMRKGSRSKKLTKREKQGNGTKAKARPTAPNLVNSRPHSAVQSLKKRAIPQPSVESTLLIQTS